MHAMAMMPVSRRRGSGCIGEVPRTQAEALAVANEGVQSGYFGRRSG